MNRPDPLTITAAVADVLACYAYAFAAQALTPPDGPHAPAAYWMTQAWVYLLIAPVAAVATWQALRHFAGFRAGDRRWWRLPMVGAAVGAGGALALMPLAAPGLADAVLGIAQLAGLGGGLGLMLAAINFPIAHLARPAAAAA
ncbi:hypothetical protein [Longimicrobium sp.]|uniref:hypothetical protein n=1 Tax=Longimicrobium sp. TaxID=2029185 RepID=UPI002E36D12D|nr:hypothetical protein [Longimicrobium sp.]HEX6040622.1 hypothetical protein [Longimicrobium sp.]